MTTASPYATRAVSTTPVHIHFIVSSPQIAAFSFSSPAFHSGDAMICLLRHVSYAFATPPSVAIISIPRCIYASAACFVSGVRIWPLADTMPRFA